MLAINFSNALHSSDRLFFLVNSVSMPIMWEILENPPWIYNEIRSKVKFKKYEFKLVRHWQRVW